jgi:hypothetical protein
VAPRSSSLTGSVALEFTSSPHRWFSPSDSYLIIGFDAHVSNADVDDWVAIDYDGATPYVGATLAQTAGSCFFSSVTLAVNGVLCGTLNNPAQVPGLITKTELSRDYANTAGTSEALGTTGAGRATQVFGIKTAGDTADRTAFELVYKPPIGFLRTLKAFPGARITLTFTVAPDYGSRVLTGITDAHDHTIQGPTVATPTADTDYRIKLTSMRYMAAMMTPLNSPSIPSSVLLPMYEIASSAHQVPNGVTAGSMQNLTFSVPPSTFKLAVVCQRADAGTGNATRQREVTEFRANIVPHLSVSYAGYLSPATAYMEARSQPERPFADFVHATLAAQSGRATVDTLASFVDSPCYVCRFAKPANDASTNATVRISFAGDLGTAVNVFVFAYFQSTCALSFDSSGISGGETPNTTNMACVMGMS